MNQRISFRSPTPPKLDNYRFDTSFDALTHPGRVLLEKYIRPAEITTNQLADFIKVPRKDIARLVLEQRPMTTELSVRLGRYFGLGSSFFMRIQVEYDAFQYTRNHHEELKYIEPFK